MDDIYAMLKREDEYSRLTKELLAIRELQETPEAVERMARLLGIFPDQSKDSLKCLSIKS